MVDGVVLAHGLSDQTTNRLRRSSPFFHPGVQSFFVKPDLIIVLRIIGTDDFQKTAISRRTGISYNDPINRLFSATVTCQANSN